MSTRRLLVLGGGVSGCVAAAGAARAGADVTLVEAEPRLGGLQRSVAIDGLVFDIGAFVFDRSNSLFTSFPQLRRSFMESPFAAEVLTPQLSLDAYPMTLRGYLRDHGLARTMLGGIRLLVDRVRWRRHDSLPAYVRHHVGGDFYVRSGLRRSLERFYQLDESQIDLAYALQRLTPIAELASLRRLLAHSADRDTARRTDGPWRCMVRPRAGFGEVFREVAEELGRAGVDVVTGERIVQMRRAGDEHRVNIRGAERRFDRVVSTLPLPVLASVLGIDATGVQHLSLISLFYRLHGRLRSSACFLYNFAADGMWRRMVVHSACYGTCGGDHYFTVEVPRRRLEPKSQRCAALDFESHAARSQIFDGRLDLVGSCVTAFAYPLLRTGFAACVAGVRDRAAALGVETIGRQGTFRHISSHEVAMEAQQFAEQINPSREGVEQCVGP